MVLEMELRDNDYKHLDFQKPFENMRYERKLSQRQITVNTSWDLLLKSR